MEITINIDGKEVPFKTNGAVAPRYMAQFKRDLLKDILTITIGKIDLEKATDEEKLMWIRDNIDFMLFYNIAWVFAKTADKTIGEPMVWLETFDTFPIIEVITPLMELLEVWLGTKKKPKMK